MGAPGMGIRHYPGGTRLLQLHGLVLVSVVLFCGAGERERMWMQLASVCVIRLVARKFIHVARLCSWLAAAI